jgi:steroid delta-isomerase-like uncharacterized protein
MAALSNTERIRRGLEEIWNQHNWDASVDYYAPDIVVHAPSQPEPLRGREGFEQLFRMLHTAYPDLHIELHELFGDGEYVATLWTLTGTNTGPFLGFPPTGRRIEVKEQGIYRFENGLCKEYWPMPDMLGELQQLGFVPTGPPPRIILLVMRLFRLLRRLRPTRGRG